VLDVGPVGRTLAEAARTAAADVVALATHGRTGVGRLWHRGVAAYLTRHLSVPILAVHAPEGPPPPLDRHFEFRHVLLPLGGSTYSEAVLDHAARLGEAFGARFTLLRVVEPPTEIGYTLLGQDGHVNHFQLEDLHEAATAQLQAPAGRLRERGIDALVDVADSAEPAEAILEYARESGADLIAMETHGLGTAAHLFAASVVEDVVHGARVPVLLHHADAPVAGERAYEDSIRRGMGWSAHGAAEEPAAPAG
jgi:nucleotide-binding universal stress UspA family protein